jgi:dolichol-phosphate mannosyltransferase
VLRTIGNDYEILVVNDGSSDNTAGIVKEYALKNKRIKLINHDKNRGYAAATRTCLENLNGDVIFIIDSDGQHTMKDIPFFLDKINDGYDAVVGWKKKRNDPFVRVAMSKIYNILFRILFKSKLHDVDCGFRCFTKESARKIKIEIEGVPVGPEIFAKAQKYGVKIAEIPIRHFPRKAGKSIFRPHKMPVMLFTTVKNLMKLRRELKNE